MSLDTVKLPTLDQLRETAGQLGLTFPEADLAAHHTALIPALAAYNALDRMPDELPPVIYPRVPGCRPAPAENRYGPGTSRPISRVPLPESSRARGWR